VLAAWQPAPDLQTVLARVGDYVERYQGQLSVLVADEEYTQRVTGRRPGAVDPRRRVDATGEPDERHLRSEFALVRVSDERRWLWLAFRDVLEVDGRPAADHGDRLRRLFVEAPADALAQARAIAGESARYNIGAVERTINVPTLALEFLAGSFQERVRYRKRAEEVVGGQPVWLIAFEERARPTLIRRPNGGDIRARGLAWVEPATGHVLRTQLDPDMGGGEVSHISVSYARDARLDLLVPVEMSERYDTSRGLITGRAVYTNFRQFVTSVRVR